MAYIYIYDLFYNPIVFLLLEQLEVFQLLLIITADCRLCSIFYITEFECKSARLYYSNLMWPDNQHRQRAHFLASII